MGHDILIILMKKQQLNQFNWLVDETVKWKIGDVNPRADLGVCVLTT